MKKFILSGIALTALLMLTGICQGQITTESYDVNRIPTVEKTFNQGGNLQTNEKNCLLNAYKHLKKAGVVNYLALYYGLGANTMIAVNGGFPKYDSYYWKKYSPYNILGSLTFGGLSMGLMIFPPNEVRKARIAMAPLLQDPEYSERYRLTNKYLNAAQVLTAAAPVLTFFGAAMVITGYVTYHPDYYNYSYNETSHKKDRENSGLEIAGWTFIGAGLLTSIASAVMIDLSKKELKRQSGNVSLKAGKNGIGVAYTLP